MRPIWQNVLALTLALLGHQRTSAVMASPSGLDPKPGGDAISLLKSLKSATAILSLECCDGRMILLTSSVGQWHLPLDITRGVFGETFWSFGVFGPVVMAVFGQLVEFALNWDKGVYLLRLSFHLYGDIDSLKGKGWDNVLVLYHAGPHESYLTLSVFSDSTAACLYAWSSVLSIPSQQECIILIPGFSTTRVVHWNTCMTTA